MKRDWKSFQADNTLFSGKFLGDNTLFVLIGYLNDQIWIFHNFDIFLLFFQTFAKRASPQSF